MASRLPFPVGFKNDFLGALEPAVFGALSARTSHSHIGLDPTGRVSAIVSNGNPFAHIVLRGSEQGPNYDEGSISTALKLLEEHGLPQQLLIDCSHGNSNKNLQKQKEAFCSVINQAALDPNRSIAGVMLESHLFEGRQQLFDAPASLSYGISITDPCLSWEETEELIRWADERLSSETFIPKQPEESGFWQGESSEVPFGASDHC
jgi:3-deoxy-7-phosphoheptulonate synthase